ncbi:histidine kinase [Chitinophaga agrisoli]|uniref:Histidine kinase n=1 Tax=Chitinophaga agrisoli TaxID=2607653 RepID=A0A5B2VT64_9BACT|nr:sensor histidine kinase [Chitinophaga agrisoli]KAA2242993.1 histidine kinase [Chitinophaga agrisoli]
MKRLFVVLLHTGYWLLYALLVFTFVWVLIKTAHMTFNNVRFLAIHSPVMVVSFPPALLGFYSAYLVLFRLLQRKQFLPLLGLSLLFALAAGVITYSYLELSRNIAALNGPQERIQIVIFLSLLAYLHSIIALVMKGFISWYGDIRLKENLSRKNFETELALVKSQIHPHFLFNTINNIDVLIEKDAARASLYLNKLSDIMRFMLYETKAEQMPLSKELDYINKYIALQQIRSANANYVRYQVEGDAANNMIAPMLFIPYIENAFKYAEHRKSENAINIQLKIEKDIIHFNCENMYKRELPPQSGNNGYNGLGNELLQKRLQLLYPGKHSLHITHDNGVYKVNLMLQTHEH